MLKQYNFHHLIMFSKQKIIQIWANDVIVTHVKCLLLYKHTTNDQFHEKFRLFNANKKQNEYFETKIPF